MTDGSQILYLSHRDVRNALPMVDAIAAMRDGFTSLARGGVTMPMRTCMPVPGTQGLMALMPCHAADIRRMSAKIISQFVQPPGSSLPLVQALVFLADTTDGRLLALMDGSAITALRTGAAAAVATQILARSDASVAAIFGAGMQARTQLDALRAVRTIRQAFVYDADPAAAHRFAAEMSAVPGCPVTVAATPAKALEHADIVCTATTAHSPLFKDADLPKGVHINAVGTWKPDRAELPVETIQRALVFVDQKDAALDEAGDLIMPLNAGLITMRHIRGELGELLVGSVTGRSNPDEVTVFKSVGLAVQDVYAASRAYDTACQRGIGTILDR